MVGVAALFSFLLLGGASYRTALLDPDLTLLTGALVLAVALCALVSAARSTGAPGPAFWLGVAALWSGVTALTADYPRAAWEATLTAGLAAGFAQAGGLLSRDRATGRQALLALLVPGAVIGLWAIAEGAGRSAPETLFLTEFGRARAVASLNHPNNLAGLLALLAPLALGAARALWGEGQRAVGAVCVAVGVLLLVASAATYSKGGQLALLAALLVLAAALPPHGWRAWWRRDPRRAAALGLLVGLVLLAGAAAFWRSGAAARLRLFVDLLPTLPQFERWGTWVAALRMVAAHPLTGVGAGGFGVASAAYKLPQGHAELFTHAHSWYLQTAAEQGLPGLLWLVLAGLAAARATLAQWRQAAGNPERWWSAALLAALAGFAAAGLLDVNVGVPSLGLTFWFVLGLAGGPAAVAPQRYQRVLPVAVGALLVVLAPWAVCWNRGHATYQQACLAVTKGRLDQAAERLEAAVALDPALRAYRLVRADLALWSGQWARAEELLQAQRHARPSLETSYRLRLAWLLAARGQLAEARQVAGEAAAANPAEPVVDADAGWLALFAGDEAAASAAWRRAVARTPNAAGADVGLGELARRQGDPAAGDWLAKAAAMDTPRDRPGRFLIADGRLDPLPLLPVALRQRVAAGDRERRHGARLARLRSRAAALKGLPTAE